MGNVYVQFREEEQAANALRNLSGRFYAGQLEFLSPPFPLSCPLFTDHGVYITCMQPLILKLGEIGYVTYGDLFLCRTSDHC